MFYFFRTWLREVYIANAPFTKSESTFICFSGFISLKISSGFAFLVSLSVPKYTVGFLCLCRAEIFVKLYGFCTK